MQGVQFVLDPAGDTTPAQAMGAIQSGQTATWSNGVVDLDPDPDVSNTVDNAVYLSAPAPAKIRASVFCNGFSSAANAATLDLAPYPSPTPAGAFLLPSPPATCGPASTWSLRPGTGPTAELRAARFSLTTSASRARTRTRAS